MGVGVHVGIAVGMTTGVSVGVGVDPFGGGIAGVTRDSASQIYVPASAAEWTKLMTAAGLATGNPSRLWLMQEPSGNPADSIGTTTLTALNISYQQSVAGWTRSAIAWTDGNNANLLNSTDLTLPDVSTKSVLVLAYQAVTSAPAAERDMILAGSVSGVFARVTTAQKAALNIAGGSDTVGASVLPTIIQPWAMKSNITSSAQALYTAQDKIAPTFATPVTGKGIFFAASISSPASTQIVYAAQFEGSAAELSDAQVKKLLQTLGWSIGWS